MKKLIPSLILAAFACSPLYAAETSVALVSGTSTPVLNTTGCLILSATVNVGLSANVQGAVYCRQANGTQPSTILVGTCHTAGLTKTRDVACTRTLQDDMVTYTYAPTTCSAANFPVDLPVTTVSITGPSMFSANTSSGGGIAENNMDETCNGANVLADVLDLAAAL